MTSDLQLQMCSFNSHLPIDMYVGAMALSWVVVCVSSADKSRTCVSWWESNSMDLHGDREGGVPPSTTALRHKHESQSKVQRWTEHLLMTSELSTRVQHHPLFFTGTSQDLDPDPAVVPSKVTFQRILILTSRKTLHPRGVQKRME